MSFFCIGLVRGYSSPAVPSIMEHNPDLLPTKHIASWASMWATRCIKTCNIHHLMHLNNDNEFATGSIAPLGAMFGSMTAFPLLHFYGRKNTLLLASPLWTVAWISIATAADWRIVILGRILSGYCVGLCLPSAQIYVSISSQIDCDGKPEMLNKMIEIWWNKSLVHFERVACYKSPKIYTRNSREMYEFTWMYQKCTKYLPTTS